MRRKKFSEIFSKVFFEVSGESHGAEKCKRGTLWDFLNIHSVAKYKILKGDPFETLKEIAKNSLTKPK